MMKGGRIQDTCPFTHQAMDAHGIVKGKHGLRVFKDA